MKPWTVVLSLRLKPQIMIKNYITVAIRNMSRNKAFTAINVLGLAVAMSISLILIMMVADQLSYDRHLADSDRIYRVTYDNLNSDGMFSAMATSSPMIGPTLKDRFSGVSTVARLRGGFGNNWIGVDNDLNVPIGGFFVDPEVLEVFEYRLEHGNPITALQEPRSVVITKTASEKLFTMDNSIGEMIEVGDLGEFKITGVLEKTDKKSHIKFEALASMSSLPSLVADSLLRSDATSWGDMWSFWTYIKLEPGVQESDILSISKPLTRNNLGRMMKKITSSIYKSLVQSIQDH